MKQKTLDILDKELSPFSSSYLALNPEIRFNWFKEEYLADRNYWDKYYPLINKYTYSWNEFKYPNKK